MNLVLTLWHHSFVEVGLLYPSDSFVPIDSYLTRPFPSEPIIQRCPPKSLTLKVIDVCV